MGTTGMPIRAACGPLSTQFLWGEESIISTESFLIKKGKCWRLLYLPARSALVQIHHQETKYSVWSQRQSIALKNFSYPHKAFFSRIRWYYSQLFDLASDFKQIKAFKSRMFMKMDFICKLSKIEFLNESTIKWSLVPIGILSCLPDVELLPHQTSMVGSPTPLEGTRLRKTDISVWENCHRIVLPTLSRV